ncbi:MAG TPA: DUF1761 domain-containing protein [Candidatus Saccharimonadia bacterium]|nr:DUF1761 domain-containing protein [Candidatus Saccharimonadia bacterium]
MLFGISGWWLLLAVVVYFGVGALWYSPVMFMKMWQGEIKKKTGDMNMAASSMIITFLAMLVLVAVEAYIIQSTGTQGAFRGAYLGAKLWLGFVATTALINNVFQGTSKKLYAIDLGYHLVGIVLTGAILAH